MTESIGIQAPRARDLTVIGKDDLPLIVIHPDGTVTGAVADMSEAGKVFAQFVQRYLFAGNEYRCLGPGGDTPRMFDDLERVLQHQKRGCGTVQMRLVGPWEDFQ